MGTTDSNKIRSLMSLFILSVFLGSMYFTCKINPLYQLSLDSFMLVTIHYTIYHLHLFMLVTRHYTIYLFYFVLLLSQHIIFVTTLKFIYESFSEKLFLPKFGSGLPRLLYSTRI